MTAHEKEKVIKYGYEKWKKRNYKECIIDLLYNFASIGLFGIPLLFYCSKIISIKWVGIAFLLFLNNLIFVPLYKITSYMDFHYTISVCSKSFTSSFDKVTITYSSNLIS